ncbi:MAG: NAD(P)-binding domain-containing protein, partial [Opitutales bacterium]|nr:NAD(P)-binding domain-containing protein [Opitutales bacterium]
MTEAMKPKIAFLGTGLMGAPMCRCLLKAGFELSVWNRSIVKAEALQADGATLAETPIAAVKGAEVVITMLSDGPAVSDLMFDQGMAEAIAEGATRIDMSSIGADEAME